MHESSTQYLVLSTQYLVPRLVLLIAVPVWSGELAAADSFADKIEDQILQLGRKITFGLQAKRRCDRRSIGGGDFLGLAEHPFGGHAEHRMAGREAVGLEELVLSV